MRKVLQSTSIFLFLATSWAFGQGSVVIRGETSTGVYQNIGAVSGAIKTIEQGGTIAETASNLWVSGTSAVNAALTVTLPAVSGQFHYITSIQIQKLYNVIGVASATGNIITTTNLPGNPAFTTEQLASAAGTVVTVVSLSMTSPIKSSVVNTATTIVMPQQLQTIWRANVNYYTAP